MYKPQIKVRGKHGDKPDKSELYDKYCRTSHEVRGLKYNPETGDMMTIQSHLTRGAWIEIVIEWAEEYRYMSHLTRGAWIEIANIGGVEFYDKSHLTRGAWIEMQRARRKQQNSNSRTSHEVRGLKY